MRNPVAIALVILAVYGCSTQPKTILQPDTDLALDKPTDTLTLVRHDADTFRVGLEKGGFVFGNANQLSVDVVVQVFNPAGKSVATFDSPARGRENFDFQTDTTGVYKIVISPFRENKGDYVLTLKGAEPISTDINK